MSTQSLRELLLGQTVQDLLHLQPSDLRGGPEQTQILCLVFFYAVRCVGVEEAMSPVCDSAAPCGRDVL